MDTNAGSSGPEIEYGIGDLSREFDVTLRSLRFYEQKGLLSPRREGRMRIYSRDDRTRLKLILKGKRVGLSLLDIKEIFTLYEANDDNLDSLNFALEKGEEQMQILERQRDEIEASMENLEVSLAGLRKVIAMRQSRTQRKDQEPSPLHV